MARAADTGGGSGPPFVKFIDHGQTLVGAFASAPRECKRQRRNYDTGEPATKPDGGALLEEVMYFIAMPGTTAVVGNSDSGFEAINEMDEVRFSVSGYKWGQVIDARKGLEAFAGFKAGQPCSGDVYTITLIGWSAETKNAAAATKAGFTVIDNRIVLRSQEAKDAYVLAQSRSQGNTNPAKDFLVEIRRATPADKAYEQAADALFDSKPWVRNTDNDHPAEAAGAGGYDPVYDEPF